MNTLAQIIERLNEGGYLISTSSQVLNAQMDSEHLKAALGQQLTICPAFDMAPVAIFDGSSFDSPHLLFVLGSLVDSLLRLR